MTDNPQPSSKQEILDLIRDERHYLEDVIRSLGEAQMLVPDLESGRSVKDLLAHIAAWERLMTKWINESYAGVVPQRPAPGMTWDDLDQLNEQIYQENKDRSLSVILAQADLVYEQALKVVNGMTDEDLFDGARFPWRNGDPVWHMIAANTWWHYKEHREQIEAWQNASY